MTSQRLAWTDLPAAARLFLAGVPLIALAIGAWLQLVEPLDGGVWTRVTFWALLAFMGHSGEFELVETNGARIFMSAGFAISVAALADLPPLGAMVAVGLGSLTWNQIANGVPAYAVIFNRGALALCAAAGSLVFRIALGYTNEGMLAIVLCSLLAAGVYFLLNVALVGVATGLRLKRPWRHAWYWPFRQAQALLLNYLGLALIGDLMLILAHESGRLGVLLALAPLAMSYVSLRQLATVRVMHRALLSSLVDSLDLRDHETGGHTRRVAALAVRLGRKLKVRGQDLEDLYAAALLHDLGKIGISDEILHKPGPLTPDEWATMRTHPALGAELLQEHPRLQDAVRYVRHHQERFDGQGYPHGLKGDEIPLGARIIAVADTFMALVDGRPYQPSIPPAAAMAELQRCAGTQFDPKVVEALTVQDWEAVRADDVSK